MTPSEQNPSPRAPRRSRDDIVDAALRLLDELGLPDLSMRRLADALGVQPSALYWHVASKQELLAAVSERILAPLRMTDASPGGSIAGSARLLGDRLRERLLTYRDGAEVVSSSLALGLVTSPVHAELARLAEPGVPVRAIADAVTHFVVGYTFHEQQRRAADGWGATADAATLTPAHLTRTGDDFRAALDLIAAGIDAGSRSTGR